MMRHRQAASLPKRAADNSSSNGEYKEKKQKNVSSPFPVLALFLFMCSCIAGVLVSSNNNKTNPNEMKGYVMVTKPEKFAKVPKGHEKTFWTDGAKITFPLTRALRDHGWIKVNDWKDAQIIHLYGAKAFYFTNLQPWQRFNHVPRYSRWNHKDEILDGFKDYQAETGSELYFMPESYRLTVEQDRKEFRDNIKNKGGMNHPWVLKKPRVNQGKGIEMIPPNSPRLLEVAEKNVAEKEEPDFGYIIQRYICNELTWNHRKYDVRMFWFVASLDPLVVLYHDGYVRIGNAAYDESDWSSTRQHLTTHTGLGEEGKATYNEFNQHILQHYKSSPQLRHIRDPVQHVKNQFKDTLAEFVEAFSEISLEHPGEEDLVPENGFGFYGADFILDADLDVWFIEPQKGCGLDEDYKMRVEMHDKLFGGMVDTLEEVWQKQEAGEPLLPLQNTGGWEIIYGDGWRYRYEGYERSKNKAGCGLTK